MELFTKAMDGLNSVVWCMGLVILCLGAGLWFSIRMKFPQVRMFKEMVRLLIHGEKSDTGITPFQAFAATVGSRVGMGNIAGVATAIFSVVRVRSSGCGSLPLSEQVPRLWNRHLHRHIK